MRGQIDRTDLVTGLCVAGVGLFAVVQGIDYDLGTLRRMGPGFFPTAIGVILIFLGIAIGLAGVLATESEEPPLVNLRSAALVLAAIGAFAFLIKPLGMVPSVFAAVLLAAMADPNSRFVEALLVAVVMSAIGVGVFIYGLGFQAVPFGRY